jgi:hypothetical protein
MKQYFFFNVFRKTIIQFFDAFNDIKIARYAADGKTVDRYITVPIKHSVKEKVYYWLNERKDDEILPMITAYISAIDFAADRKANGNYSFTASCTNIDAVDENTGKPNPSVSTFLHPCPYNLTFTMNIWALHMVDIDQIMEQILPFFCPHAFIRVYLDDLDIAYDVKVIFRSATPEISHEMADLEYRVINYTLDFDVQTWFFKPISDVGLIKSIYGSYPVSGALDTTSTSGAIVSGASLKNTLSFQLKGRIEDGEIITKYTLFEP